MDKEAGLEILQADTDSEMELPCPDDEIKAGFPSPADNRITETIDLNRVLVRHRESTFYARISGNSMEGAGISDGDLVVIDKSLTACDGDYVAAYIDGEFTVKEFKRGKTRDKAWLVPANDNYKAIRVTAENSFMIWGVITYAIKKLHK